MVVLKHGFKYFETPFSEFCVLSPAVLVNGLVTSASGI